MRMRLFLVVGTALVLAGSGLGQTPEPAASNPVVPAEATVLPVGPVENGSWFPGGGNQGWVRSEYLLTWVRGQQLPPLVTTSVPGTPLIAAGVLGQTTTTTLFGDESVDTGIRSGLRLGAGYWLDPERTVALEAGFMMVASQSKLFGASSDGSTILARPFFNVVTFMPDAVVVAFPGQSAGSIEAWASSGNFYTGSIDLSEIFVNENWLRVSSIFGYRFYRYDEALHVRQTALPTNGNFVPGTIIVSDDDFATQNEFHGIDLGLRAQLNWQDFSLELLGKVAAGHLQRRINIQGSQVTTVPGIAPVVSDGGVLALSSNEGLHKKGDWTVMPEFGVNLNWRLNANVCFRAGYSVLWLDSIARAADQLDFIINPALFPPAQAGASFNGPLFNVNKRDIWIQSLTFGVEFTF